MKCFNSPPKILSSEFSVKIHEVDLGFTTKHLAKMSLVRAVDLPEKRAKCRDEPGYTGNNPGEHYLTHEQNYGVSIPPVCSCLKF